MFDSLSAECLSSPLISNSLNSLFMRFKNFALSFLVVFSTIFTSGSLLAQDTKPKREVGLQFNSFDFDGGSGFSAFFKKQKKENVYRRIRLFSGGLSFRSTEETNFFDFSAGIAIGREKRKSLDAKLEFYQGPEFAINLAVGSLNDDDLGLTIAPAFGWVLGLQHSFNERWAVNVETIPRASVAFDNFSNADGEIAFNAGFNNAVSIGLVRKF